VDLRVSNLENTYLQLQQKAIEPLYECKSDFQIAAEIGRRMGFGQYFGKTEEQYIDETLASGHPAMEGVTMERLKEGPVVASPLDRPKQFGTPSGRIEFYVERLKRFGQELPIYLEPVESNRSEKAKAYPLCLLSTHSRHRTHSTMANIPSLLKLDPEPTLEINPADAGPRNIGDRDVVRVFNDRGQAKLRAKLSQRIKPGVVNVMQGWWPEQYIEGHHNELTHDMINPAQQLIMDPNAALYDVLVEVEKA
jgi:molybdopterin-containing oxidoreductase family molybdopterin binding subunit